MMMEILDSLLDYANKGLEAEVEKQRKSEEAAGLRLRANELLRRADELENIPTNTPARKSLKDYNGMRFSYTSQGYEYMKEQGFQVRGGRVYNGSEFGCFKSDENLNKVFVYGE